MPRRYLAEMVIDRIAASKVYHGKAYQPADPYLHFQKSSEKSLMHPQTQRQLCVLLEMLRDQGEAATFQFIRQTVLTGKPF